MGAHVLLEPICNGSIISADRNLVTSHRNPKPRAPRRAAVWTVSCIVDVAYGHLGINVPDRLVPKMKMTVLGASGPGA